MSGQILTLEFIKRQKQVIEGRIQSYRKIISDANVLPGRAALKGSLIPLLQAALQRISQNKYGICADCGSKIEIKRLKSIPAAIRCRECQERFEVKHAEGLPYATRI